MKPGLTQIVVGLILAGAGLSGQFAMIGTKSPTGLIVIGGALIALGAFRLVRASRAAPPDDGDDQS